MTSARNYDTKLLRGSARAWACTMKKHKWILAKYTSWGSTFVEPAHHQRSHDQAMMKTSTYNNPEMDDGELHHCVRKRKHSLTGCPKLKNARYHDNDDEEKDADKSKMFTFTPQISSRFQMIHGTISRCSAYH